MVILIYPQLEGVSAKHGFEAALVMCGKVVNEDTSLGFVHTTAGAKKVSFVSSMLMQSANLPSSFSKLAAGQMSTV